MGLKVTGIKSTTARLDNILERSNRKAYDILKKASEDAKKRIELQMHRDTGAMERATAYQEAARVRDQRSNLLRNLHQPRSPAS